MRHSSTNQSGFTIVELLIVMSVISVLILLIYNALFDFFSAQQGIINSTVQTSDSRAALSTIERDVSVSRSVQRTSVVADPENTGGWSWTGSPTPDTAKRVLILTTYATTVSSGDATRVPILSQASSCQLPLEINTIYFVRDSTLYRRTLVPDESPRCGPAPFQKQTCSSSSITATSPCQASDAAIARNVEGFSVDYFDAATASSPLVNQYDTVSPPDISTIKTITIRLSIRNTSQSPSTTEVRVGLR